MTRRSFDREAIEAEIDRVRSLGVDGRCEDHNKSQSDEGWRRGLSSMTGAASDPAGLESANLDHEIAGLRGLDPEGLRARWRTVFRRHVPCHLPRHLLFRILAYRLQAYRLGDAIPLRGACSIGSDRGRTRSAGCRRALPGPGPN